MLRNTDYTKIMDIEYDNISPKSNWLIHTWKQFMEWLGIRKKTSLI